MRTFYQIAFVLALGALLIWLLSIVIRIALDNWLLVVLVLLVGVALLGLLFRSEMSK